MIVVMKPGSQTAQVNRVVELLEEMFNDNPESFPPDVESESKI